jgi:AcrR family transcriptional regulator
MSKSGLFAHFGSKEELQLAVLRAARERLEAAVAPAYEARKGIARLHALMDEWLGFLASGTYDGGDPLLSAATDQAARPGPVRDLAAEAGAWWLGELRAQAERALERGELRTGGDAARLAWELHAYGLAYDWDRRLTGAEPAEARAAVEERLAGAATGKGRKRLVSPGAR